MADRFFCPDLTTADRLVLDPDEARHLVRSLRKQVGDVVEVFDGRGHATLARVTALGRDRVELLAEGPSLPDHPAAREVRLAVAPPKGDRLDWLVEKATELGVAELALLITARAVVEPSAHKLDRLRRRSIEACKQSGRNAAPRLKPARSWADHLDAEATAARWLAHPGGDPWPALEPGEPLALAIGPEGGFNDREVELARLAGWRVVALTATVLRVETAALAAAARALIG